MNKYFPNYKNWLILILSFSLGFINLVFNQEKPNIIIILADDMGYGDARTYRADSKIPTPHIDALAARGMKFLDAHSPSSVCTPTRYSILTGRYAWRSKLKSGVLQSYAPPLIETERETLPKFLKKRGYHAGVIGKWHLGMFWPRKSGELEVPRPPKENEIDFTGSIGGPLKAGFDYYFGVDAPNYPPYIFLENDRIVGKLPTIPKPPGIYGKNGIMQEGWDLEKIMPAITQKSVEYINKHASSPFFLYIPLTAPHTPIVPSKNFQGKSQAGPYGDLVVEVDNVVGEVTKTLKAKGIWEKTIVIFSSDNGSPAVAGDRALHGGEYGSYNTVTKLFDHKPNAPWRGLKADIEEAGHRVPFIVSWPEKIRRNSTSTELVSSVDIFATISTILGENLPKEIGEDSYSIWPALLEKNTIPIREALVHHSHRGKFSIRQGKWKYIDSWGSGGFSSPANLTAPENEPGRLYDISNDTLEQNSLYLAEIEKAKQLENLLQTYKDRGRSTPEIRNDVGCLDSGYAEYNPKAATHNQTHCLTLGVRNPSILKFVDLRDKNLSLTKEGNYVVLITNSKGQILFKKNLIGLQKLDLSHLNHQGLVWIKIHTLDEIYVMKSLWM